ncbi:MAG: NTPase [Candidatus Thorarchaeota archaeon]
MTTNILLTGKPGIGKTTAIKRIVEKLDPDEFSGLYSREMREGNKRVGFVLETFSGKSGILAHVNISSVHRVSKYGVNIKDINAIAVPELRLARETGKIIIIDEIAKMELFSRLFADEVTKCLNTKRVLGTIQQGNHPFLNEIKSRPDVQLIELTTENRDQIPMHVLKILKV